MKVFLAVFLWLIPSLLGAQQVSPDSLYEFYSLICHGSYTYADGMSREEYKSCQDSIRSVATFELLDNDPVPPPMVNPYLIDTERVQTDISETDWFNDFLLPLNGGKDTIRISDYDGEGYISMRYVGQLEPLNAYLINAEYENPSHKLIDRTTGETRWFSTGIPFISPDGKHLVSFYQPITIDRDYACVFTVNNWEGAEKMDNILSVSFSSWLPVLGPRMAWWASNNEFVMQVFPVSFLQNDRNTDPNYNHKKGYQTQFMRVTFTELGN